MASRKLNRYQSILKKVFFDRYQEGDREVLFDRDDLVVAASELDIDLPKNLGDVIYSVRYRTALPKAILKKQTTDEEWVIEGAGRAKYAFRLGKVNRILPNTKLIPIKVPDATPEIVNAYTLSDEQALLSKLRYNRLIDLFLEATCYSLQNHLRTTVQGMGQIEIDELYVGIAKSGAQYIVPVQAKGGSDSLGIVQAKQDIQCCSEKFPDLRCRALSTQFIENDLIAIFELALTGEQLGVVEERHYKLVPHSEISSDDLKRYAR